MNADQFLALVLPKVQNPIYLLTFPYDKGKWAQRTFTSIKEAAYAASRISARGLDAYFACGSLRQHSYTDSEGKVRRRTKQNILSLQSFFLDFDVGKATNSYATVEDAMRDLKRLVDTVGLPTPLVVSSGAGLHVYWPLTHPVTSESWAVVANKFKAVTVALGMQVDPVRTADQSSVLRVVGTTHTKTGNTVKTLNGSPVVPAHPSQFKSVIEHYIAIHGVTVAQRQTTVSNTNSEWLGYETKHYSFKKIRTKCAQMEVVAALDANGNIDVARRAAVSNPLWYNALGLMVHCNGWEQGVQEISKGYPGYNPAHVEAQARRWKDNNMGPTLCSTFDACNPGLCGACPHKGSVSTPLQLGEVSYAPQSPTPAPVQLAVPAAQPVTINYIEPPAPYIRSKGRIYIKYAVAEGEDQFDLVMDYDICGIGRFTNEKGLEEFHFHVWKPGEIPGVGTPTDLVLQTTEVNENRTLISALGKIGIIVHNPAVVATFMRKYITDIQSKIGAQRFYTKLGWNGDEFITGSSAIKPGARPTPIPPNMHPQAKELGLETAGTLEAWKEAAKVFTRPGMEPYLFSFLIAFAAPLFKFTGQVGAVVNMQGETGVGKTTAAQAMLSVWGHPKRMQFLPCDTVKARYARMGRLSNLPVYMEELSTMDAEELTKLVMSVPNGRPPNAQTQDGSMRENSLEWSTLVLTSSNPRLMSRISLVKSDVSADAARVLEIPFPDIGPLEKTEADQLFSAFYDNYGLAGPVYAEYLVNNREALRAKIRNVMEYIDTSWCIKSKQRFHSATIASVIVGAGAARHLGLLDVNIAHLLDWARVTLVANENMDQADLRDPENILASFMGHHFNHIMVCNHGDMTGKSGAPIIVGNYPNGSLVGRIQIIEQTMHVAISALRDFCKMRNYDIGALEVGLRKRKLLQGRAKKLSLGWGINPPLPMKVDTTCWEIKLNAAAFTSLAPLAQLGNITQFPGPGKK